MSASVPRCNGWLLDCVHEWHVLMVGLAVGLLAVWIRQRSPPLAAVFVTVALWLGVTTPIHGITKPWYVLGGALVGIALAETARAAWRRYHDK